jgi:hypothetical protein
VPTFVSVEMLAVLVRDGLVTVEHRAMRAGRQPIRVTWLAITEAGRQAVVHRPRPYRPIGMVPWHGNAGKIVTNYASCAHPVFFA